MSSDMYSKPTFLLRQPVRSVQFIFFQNWSLITHGSSINGFFLVGFCPHPPEISSSKPGSAINNKDICKANHLIKNRDFFILPTTTKLLPLKSDSTWLWIGKFKKGHLQSRQTDTLPLLSKITPKERNGFSIKSCRFPLLPLLFKITLFVGFAGSLGNYL